MNRGTARAPRTNLADWPDEYCPCVVPLRQLIDGAGLTHTDCGKPVAGWEIESRKYDPQAGPRKARQ